MEDRNLEDNIGKLIKRLYDNVFSDNFTEVAYQVTDELIKSTNSFEAVDPIIRLIESNPSIDFGNPGPLVHFLEKFGEKEYDEKLIESIIRTPSGHTLFMLNRIINSIEDDDKKETYINLFDTVIDSSTSSCDAKRVAQEFKAYHKNVSIDEDNTLLELRNIVLTKPLDGQKDLIKIKSALGLDLSMKELLIGSKNLPFILVKNIPYGRAQSMVNKIGELSEKLELKLIQ